MKMCFLEIVTSLILGLFILIFGLIRYKKNGFIEASDQLHSTSNYKTFIRNVKKILPFIWPKKSITLQIKIIICFFLMICCRIVNVFVPIYAKKVVDQLNNEVFCWDLILALFGLKFLQRYGILDTLRSYLWKDVHDFIERESQIALFRHLHQLSLRWHLSRKLGEILLVIARGVESMCTILSDFLFNIIPIFADIFIALLYLSTAFNAWFILIISVMIVSHLVLTFTSKSCSKFKVYQKST